MDADAPPDTRARILRTAVELFAEHGYQRTSLRLIAEQLGLTKAAILYHFPAKAAIVAALTEPMIDDMDAALRTAARLDPTRARWAAIEGWLDVMLSHRALLTAFYRDLSVIAEEPLTRWVLLMERTNEIVAGPDAGPRERIRAVQVVATLGDPVMVCGDLPTGQLRQEILAGARQLAHPVLELPPEDGPAVADGAAAGPALPLAHRWAPVTTATPVSRRRGAGRPSVMSPERLAAARRMRAEGSRTVEEIAAVLGVSRATMYRHLDGTRSAGRGAAVRAGRHDIETNSAT
jgi:AcrR family transcriptional regulator